jgi:hypothetical protein
VAAVRAKSIAARAAAPQRQPRDWQPRRARATAAVHRPTVPAAIPTGCAVPTNRARRSLADAADGWATVLPSQGARAMGAAMATVLTAVARWCAAATLRACRPGCGRWKTPPWDARTCPARWLPEPATGWTVTRAAPSAARLRSQRPTAVPLPTMVRRRRVLAAGREDHRGQRPGRHGRPDSQRTGPTQRVSWSFPLHVSGSLRSESCGPPSRTEEPTARRAARPAWSGAHRISAAWWVATAPGGETAGPCGVRRRTRQPSSPNSRWVAHRRRQADSGTNAVCTVEPNRAKHPRRKRWVLSSA